MHTAHYAMALRNRSIPEYRGYLELIAGTSTITCSENRFDTAVLYRDQNSAPDIRAEPEQKLSCL
jgi:hypothetical protein